MEGNYCDGRADENRTDLKAKLDYLVTVIPSPNMSGKCLAGYYCEAGSYYEKQFESLPGRYTLEGAFNNDLLCPEGTYQNMPYQSSCIPCDRRYYCPS